VILCDVLSSSVEVI